MSNTSLDNADQPMVESRRRSVIRSVCKEFHLLAARHPVVIFSNAIGDHLLNLPAIRALATMFDGRLGLICERGAHAIFFRDVPFRSVCEMDTEVVAGGRVFDADAVARSLGPCDLLLSLDPWHSTSVDRLMELLSPRQSIGFFPAFQVVLPRDYSKHAAELAFDLPRFLDPKLTLDDFARPPMLPDQFVRQAQRIRRCIPPEFRVLAVHAETKPEKMWPVARFASVLEKFVYNNPGFIVLELGAQDQGLDSGHEDSRVAPCYGLALPASMSLVAQADLFLGIDSSLLHVADLFRIPGVGLFGPTNPHEWGFRFAKGRHVSGSGSMDNIGETEVLDALESLLIETYGGKQTRSGRVVPGASPVTPRAAPDGLGLNGKRRSAGGPTWSERERDLHALRTNESRVWDSFHEQGYHIRACSVRTYFSAVYRGIRLSDGQAVAIKVLAPTAVAQDGRDRKELLNRFASEVKALGAVRDNPGTVTLLGAGETEGWPYHVCEWVSGRPVLDLLVAETAQDLTTAVRTILDLAMSIQRAHYAGIAHRDIAPDHVFVNADGKTCLIDFGMAKFLKEIPRAAVQRYVSQDIRSIGLLLYEMWRGRQVFSYGRPILREQVGQCIRRLTSLRAPLPVAGIIKRCIMSGSEAPDGEEAYGEMSELAADLSGILAGSRDSEVSLACSAGAAPYEHATWREGGLRDGV